MWRPAGRRSWLWFLILAVCPADARAQTVPNGSFEDGPCPYSFNCTSLPTGWSCAGAPGQIKGTVDSYDVCSVAHYAGEAPGAPPSFGVPANFKGTQIPSDGTAYGGLIAYHYVGQGGLNCDPSSEYYQAMLAQPLVAGQTYCGELRVNRARDSYGQLAPGVFGMVLGSVADIGFSSCTTLYGQTPQVVNAAAISDTEGWQTVANTFVATGQEQYLTIGAFPQNLATQIHVDPNQSYSYVYIDDVAISLPLVHGMTLPTNVFEGDPIPLDGSSSQGATHYYVQVCRTGTDCQHENGFSMWYRGEPSLIPDLNELVDGVAPDPDPHPFTFEGSPAGISYDVTLAVQNGCDPFEYGTLPLTVFTPVEDFCTEIIDFETLPAGSGEYLVPSPWIDGDYEFTATVLATYGPDAGLYWTGSKAIHDSVAPYAGPSVIQMKRSDGRPFSACSVDLAEVSPTNNANTFRGYADTAGIEEVASQTVQIAVDTPPTVESTEFDGFRGIRMFESYGYSLTFLQWDNVCLCESDACFAGQLPAARWAGENCNGADSEGLHDATQVGTPLCPPNAKVGVGALGFNGSSHLVVPDAADLDPASGLALAAWVLVDSGATGILVEKGSLEGYRLELVGGQVRFQVSDGTSTLVALPPDDIGDSTWHHVTATLEHSGGNATLRLYIDAGLVAQALGTLGTVANADPLTIGGPSPALLGVLDDVAVFKSRLSPSEIAALYGAGEKGICTEFTSVELGGGVAVGGEINLWVQGAAISVTTNPGDDGSAIATILAQAINSHELLQNSVVATTVGSRLVLEAAGGVQLTGYSTDPAFDLQFSEPPPPPAVPPFVPSNAIPVPPLALGILTLTFVVAAGVRMHRRPR